MLDRKHADHMLDRNGKLVLDHLYNQPDPRAYFATLEKLEYRIPDAAQPIIKNLLDVLSQNRPGKRLKLCDLGCSYGVTGMLLRSGLSIQELTAHYRRHANCRLDELIDLDRKLIRRTQPVSIVGFDAAANACTYALRSGAIDAAIVANLEADELNQTEQNLISDVDLIVSTGFIGYGGELTISRILNASKDNHPWMAHLVMRPFEFAPVQKMLAKRDYVTARGSNPVFQRRFASDDERAELTARFTEVGIDPSGYEDSIGIHAELYVSRPATERHLMPSSELINPSPIVPTAVHRRAS